MIRLPVRSAIRLPGALLLSAATLAAGGCTTLGTNVSGKFACEGPDGICAPSTSIDDGAIASIETTSTELLDPAGPYQIDEGYGVPAAPVLAATAAVPPSLQADSSYTLRVVFPAFVDGAGQLHERAAVETSVRLPGRGDAVTALALRGSGSGRQGLLAAAERAPSLLALAAPAGPARAPLAGPALPSAEPGEVPAPEAVAVAAPDPVARIRDQVQTALNAERPRQQAASFPGTPE